MPSNGGLNLARPTCYGQLTESPALRAEEAIMSFFKQLWSEGGSGDGGGGGLSAAPAQASAPVSQHPGDIAAAAALQEFQQKKALKQKGKVALNATSAPVEQPTRPASAPTEQAPQQAEPAKPIDKAQAFEELIKGEYKDEYNKRTSATVQERIKNLKQAEEALAKLSPALDALYQKQNVKPGDLDGLVKSITDDDSLYEDEALQKGIPVDTLKQMKRLEAETETLKQQAQERAQQEIVQRHIQGLVEQGDALKQMYPSFDLRQEMQNEQFARLVHPSVNIDVRTAYEVVHRDQIQPAMAAAVAQKTAMDMSRSIQSTGIRPAENGISNNNPLSLSDNPANWPKDRLREIAKRVKNGERISF